MFGKGQLKRIEYLEDIVKTLRTVISSEQTARERLERIIKYARDDKPTFMKTMERKSGFFTFEEFWLYLYIDKREYKVNLVELDDCSYILMKDMSLEVKDGLAYFTVDMKTHKKIFIIKFYGTPSYVVKHVNIIDEKEEKESEGEVKECTDC